MPPRRDGLGDDLAEAMAVVVRIVTAVTVCGFHEQQVRRVCDRFRVAQHGAIVAAEVSAEHDGLTRAGDAHDHRRRAKQMAHRAEGDLDTGCDRHCAIEADWLQQFERAERVAFGEEGIGRAVA